MEGKGFAPCHSAAFLSHLIRFAFSHIFSRDGQKAFGQRKLIVAFRSLKHDLKIALAFPRVADVSPYFN